MPIARLAAASRCTATERTPRRKETASVSAPRARQPQHQHRKQRRRQLLPSSSSPLIRRPGRDGTLATPRPPPPCSCFFGSASPRFPTCSGRSDEAQTRAFPGRLSSPTVQSDPRVPAQQVFALRTINLGSLARVINRFCCPHRLLLSLPPSSPESTLSDRLDVGLFCFIVFSQLVSACLASRSSDKVGRAELWSWSSHGRGRRAPTLNHRANLFSASEF